MDAGGSIQMPFASVIASVRRSASESGVSDSVVSVGGAGAGFFSGVASQTVTPVPTRACSPGCGAWRATTPLTPSPFAGPSLSFALRSAV